MIKVQNLTKSYQMGEVEVLALKDINLEVTKGEFIVLLGHSGSGKSTLLNLLGGLDRPTSGEIFFNMIQLSQLSDAELTEYRREHIGFIFQMYNLIPRLTAEENVELVTETVENPLTAKDALKIVGLENRSHHFPSQLSGGEQQRVAIARAIAKQPDMLFCDEPTGALDLKTGILVLDAIQKVNRSIGTTTIVITHNVAIADMADRVIYLVDGQIKEIKTNKTRCSAQDLKW